jgi:peptidoglycan/xylan/chitin deacetylase (PgdA/CDA1 family)
VIKKLNQNHRYGIRVTFFVVGMNARSHLDLLKDMAHQGETLPTTPSPHRNLRTLPLHETIDRAWRSCLAVELIKLKIL